ncbi:hypothetical protein PF010_g27259 [Phytophthora fragariae]|nr:hypothetical protein PF003_g25154 [Phytophthora fragariae]KAE9067955.1 hypothetical protein PF010_g27259 [Phytophthora fragariae]
MWAAQQTAWASPERFAERTSLLPMMQPTLLAQQRQWQGCAPSFTTAPRGASPPVDDECLITFGCDSVQRFGVQLVWTPKTEGKSAWQRPLPIAVLTGFRDSQLVLPQVGSQWLQGVPATSFSCKAKH